MRTRSAKAAGGSPKPGSTVRTAVAAAGRTLVGHSAAIEAADRDIKAFLIGRMYRHPDVRKVREQADAIVRRLFTAYMTDPSAMPREWAAKADGQTRAQPSPITSPA